MNESNNQVGRIKEMTEDEDGVRQFVINCVGISDQRKYFCISPFGIEFNAPVETRGLTTNSKNKDDNFLIGVINKVKPEDLNLGESAIFSTIEDGTELKSFIKFRNDGTMEQNGNKDFIAGFNELKVGFDELKEDYNSHIHQIPIGEVITDVTGGGGAPAVGIPNVAPIDLSATDTESSASIDSSKKENLKTE